MKNNEKNVDLSLASHKDTSNLQPAADLNLPETEPTSIKLTESRDNRTNESDQQIHNLMPSMAAERDLLASRYTVPDSLKQITSLAEKYKGLMPSMAAERDLLASRYTVPDSLKQITSLAEKYKDLMPSMAAERDLLASRYTVPDSLKQITSLAEKYKGLMPSMAAERDLLASQYAVPDSLKQITSLAEKYKGLMPSMAAERDLLASRYTVPDSLKQITSLAEKYKGLMPSMAAERDLLASRYTVPDSLKQITSLAEKYKGLMPSMAAERDLLASRYTVPDSLKQITSLAEKYKDLMPASIRALGFSFDTGISNQSTLKALYNSVNHYLENISPSDLNSIINVAKEYSSTSEGAAYIATTATEINSIEPDAITKLEEVKNKNGLIRKFRELPLPLQLVVYFLIAHVFVPIIEDTLKAEALELYTKASTVIIKSLPANSYIKELISSNKEKTDFEMLKQLRIITANNVNLREKPSMKGEVIVSLDKYDVVSILDKSNRKWLYVQVLIDGEYVNGWVNRTYTKNLNKI